MMRVPRHLFIDGLGNTAFVEHAYNDNAFQIGCGQTISHPYTVAFQTEKLTIKRGEKVLEIGTGSGYQTAVLLELGAKVFTIERQKELYDKTRVLLGTLHYKPQLFYGDGYKGRPLDAPFDKIIVTAGAPFIPEELLKQLKVGGIMIIPVGEGKAQEMNLIRKTAEKEFDKNILGEFRFVPMLENKQW
jgi:protein-L-isoaspartate(D-aspartate) O-methyltransferase